MSAEKPKSLRRRWTEEEEELLTSLWGYKPMGAIAKSLGRSEAAIAHRVCALGLQPFTVSGDYVTCSVLSKTLLGRRLCSSTRKRWARLEMPIKNRTIRKRTVQVVFLEDFWAWADQHRDALDLSRLEPLALGPEPSWVAAQRRRDITQKTPVRQRRWTHAEEDTLRHMLEAGKSYEEIAHELSRTVPSISCRRCQLGIKTVPETRPIRWTPERDKLLASEILHYKTIDVVARELGCTATAVRQRCTALWGTANLDTIRQNLWRL